MRVATPHIIYIFTNKLSKLICYHNGIIPAERLAFYGLQGAGSCAKCVNPFTIAHIYVYIYIISKEESELMKT